MRRRTRCCAVSASLFHDPSSLSAADVAPGAGSVWHRVHGHNYQTLALRCRPSSLRRTFRKAASRRSSESGPRQVTIVTTSCLPMADAVTACCHGLPAEHAQLVMILTGPASSIAFAHQCWRARMDQYLV